MTAERAGAAPPCTAAPLRYADYLCLGALLGSQHPRSGAQPPAIHDEHFFIVLHQAQELWFKQILREMAAVIALDPASPRYFGEALQLVDRIAAIELALVRQLELLRTLDPAQFMALRPLLGNASGAQSTQFRLIEATAGVLASSPSRRDIEMLPAPERHRVLAALAAPSLHDGVVTALGHEAARRDGAPGNAAQARPPPVTRAWEVLPPAVLALVRRVRQGGGTHDAAIRGLLDALCGFEDALLAWREAHAAIVRDLLDNLPGTGGTAGYAYLRARLVAQPRSALATALRAPAEVLA